MAQPKRANDAPGLPKGRTRTCAATGLEAPEGALIRFALSPEGVVTPDLAAKLPGRGVWIAARRDALERACAKGAFARGFKAQIRPDPGLVDRTAGLLRARALDLLGLARRAGGLAIGAAEVEKAVAATGANWHVEAADGSPTERDRILRKAAKRFGAVEVCGCYDAEELGVALGRQRVVHARFVSERLGRFWAIEAGRLSGFFDLIPRDWSVQGWRIGG